MTQISNDTFSEEAVTRLFNIDKDNFTWASVGFGGEIIVMQVAEIVDAREIATALLGCYL